MVSMRGSEPPPLDFERLDVYRCAIELLALAVRVTATPSCVTSYSATSKSIPLNIAEASGKTGVADRARKALLTRVVSMLTEMCR
jgi:hypothetical protein